MDKTINLSTKPNTDYGNHHQDDAAIMTPKNPNTMSIGFPTVPRYKAGIRVMISAAHTREGLEIFDRVGHKLGVIQ